MGDAVSAKVVEARITDKVTSDKYFRFAITDHMPSLDGSLEK
jgi:hypothetical protein